MVQSRDHAPLFPLAKHIVVMFPNNRCSLGQYVYFISSRTTVIYCSHAVKQTAQQWVNLTVMSSLYTAHELEQNCLQHQCTAQKHCWKSQHVASLIYFNPANVSFSILLKPPQPQTMKHCSLALLANKLTAASKQQQLTLRTAEPRRIKLVTTS